MKAVEVFLTCSLLILVPQTCAEGQVWRNIVPLHSTRQDVEKVLGVPLKLEDRVAVYKLENENVRIEYSKGICSKEDTGGWNVPADTVIGVRIGLKKELLLSNLHLDEKSYKKTQDPHIATIFYYTNEEEGITYETQGQPKMVTVIYREPAVKDKYLRCPN